MCRGDRLRYEQMFDITSGTCLTPANLATALASVDRNELSDAEAVELLRARQRVINHLMAERALDMVEVCARHEGTPLEQLDACGEFAPLEVGSALRLTRRSAEAGHPVEAVDAAKQRRLTRLAVTFLKRHGLLEARARFDVLAVTWPEGRRQPTIEHFQNAFDAVGRWELYS